MLARKTLIWPLLAAAILCSSACEDVSDQVRGRFQPEVVAQTRDFSADPRATYEAARAALAPMGYRFVRGGPAEGELEAISDVMPGDVPDSSRQVSLKARFQPGPGGGTEVSVVFEETVEEDTENHQGFATTSPLAGTPLYDTFFRLIGKGLNGTMGP